MKLTLLLSLFWCSLASAAIPKASMILNRTTENAGRGIYQIDQEVQFQNGPDTLVLKESWLVENENNMKVVVTGARELKDQISFVININNGNRTSGSGPKRITEDFIERYFHLRSTDAFAQVLSQMKLIPSGGLNKKTYRAKDAEYQPENFVRLGRSGGVVTYVFGGQSLQETPSPGFWIEQDQFVLRKIRLASEVEVTADRHTSFAKGMIFPKTRVVRWGTNQVTIQTTNVNSRGKDTWAQFGSKVTPKMEALRNHQVGAIVEEFYKRFR